MKKLILSQPYASLVIGGILQTLPNEWNDLKYGEKIFIYADNIDKNYLNGLDYSKASDRRIFNEMFLGNIPDGDFPTHQYIGFVKVYHTGIVQKDWLKDLQSSIFVSFPYKLCECIENYECEDNRLENARARRVHLKKIQKVGSDLYVPVCKNIWHRLHNLEECVNVCMFWEDYMSSFTLGCFSLDNNYIEEVDEVHFQYNNKTISFLIDGGVGEKPISGYNSKEFVSLLAFNLSYLKENNVLIELGRSSTPKDSKQEENITKENEEVTDAIRKEFRPFIRFISTPMGGMTRWKR